MDKINKINGFFNYPLINGYTMDKINGFFNYPLINGYRYGFNGICTCGYPYPLLNQVYYINNLNTIQLLKKKPSML
jgi:hypothetical protein